MTQFDRQVTPSLDPLPAAQCCGALLKRGPRAHGVAPMGDMEERPRVDAGRALRAV